MGLTAEEKKDEAEQHEIEPGADGPGVRDWFADLPKAARGRRPRPLTPAATRGWRVEPHMESPGSCATMGTTWLPSRRASSSRAPKGHCARVNPIGHGPGGQPGSADRRLTGRLVPLQYAIHAYARRARVAHRACGDGGASGTGSRTVA